MCNLTEVERQYLLKTRALTRDEYGREVLIGLTHEESESLMAYRRGFSSGKRDRFPDDLTAWLELAQKHELARPPLDIHLPLPGASRVDVSSSRSADASQTRAEVVDPLAEGASPQLGSR